MRHRYWMVVIGLVLAGAAVHAQTPRMVAYADSAYIYACEKGGQLYSFKEGDPPMAGCDRTYLAVYGWASAEGFRPGRGVYIDGEFVGAGWTWERHDVCDRIAAWWGVSQCDGGAMFHCDMAGTPDGVTDACVGVALFIEATRFGSGEHRVTICANAPNPPNSSQPPALVCSGEKTFAR